MQLQGASDDASWRIEMPVGIKQELASLSARLQAVLDKSDVIEAAISRCPTMADIQPVLDHKLDASCAARLEAELDATAQALKDSQEAARRGLEQRIEELSGDVAELQRASALVATFEAEYTTLQQEAAGMQGALRQIEEHAKQNVDSSDAEVQEIRRQFTDLDREIRTMRDRLDLLQSRQQEKLAEIEAGRQDYAERFQAAHAEITKTRREAEATARRLPTLIAEARDAAEGEISGMLAKEAARRTEESTRTGKQIQALQEQLARAEEEQRALAEQLKEMREQMEAQVNAALEERTAELSATIQAQLSFFATLKDDVTESIESQRRALKKLESFSQMFREADSFWKQNLAALRQEAEERLTEMRGRLFEDARFLRETLTAAASKADDTTRLLAETGKEWETTWKQREQNVDDTLARLYKTVYDIDRSVSDEVATRSEEFAKMSSAMEASMSHLQALLASKANADDVRKALWTKADKIDL